VSVPVQIIESCGCFHANGLNKLDDMKTVERNPAMPVCQSCNARPLDAAAVATSRLAAGQLCVHDLRAGTSIVAVEGDLQLGFRDHSLAWLGDACPLMSITLLEGERFVTPQRGVVSIHSVEARSVTFAVQAASAENIIRRVFRQAVRHLGSLVKARLRRIA
jgi:hypothetical protein